MRSAAVGLAALLALAAPAGAVYRYLAFGDSITLGVLDESGAGGYPGRLPGLIGCAPPACEVHQRGQPAETTGEAVSRLDQVLPQASWDTMLLMEGTNDVFNGFSNATIQFNLEVMDAKAAAFGVDTLHASIIRFRPSVSSGAIDAQVADLRNRVAGLAAARGRYFADNWAVLCPDAACFTAHYFQPSEPQADPVGHPDASGYDIMAGVFASSIQSAPLPAAPTATSPSGDIGTSTPTYSWSAVGGATWYELEIDGGPPGLWSSGSVCAGGSCAVTPSLPLADGGHSFRVRGRNPAGDGGWSGTLAFTVFSSPPATPATKAPAGDVFGSPSVTPTYTWSAAAGATSYDLRVVQNLGAVNEESFPASVCSGSTCSATPAAPLAAGDYLWDVRGVNPAGAGARSPSASFRVFTSPPLAPALWLPLESTFATQPLFQWQALAGADAYHLVARDGGGLTVLDATLTAGAACAVGACGWTATTALVPKAYAWTVQASNPLGSGPASATAGFELLDCASAPDLDPLSPATVTGPRSERACGRISAGPGGFEVGAGGDLELFAGGQVTLADGFSVTAGELRVRTDP